MAAPFLTLSNLYLNVPFEEKDKAKSRGARWDNKNKLWYAPTGLDPLEFRAWWAFLNPVYKDRETLKKKGAIWTPEIKKWLVPAGKDFDYFTKWWPKDLQQYIFDDRFVCQGHRTQGGQSDVFQAYDIRAKEGGYYAVKVFNKAIGSNPESEAAFLKELNALTDLEGHPNILNVETWGMHERSGRKFMITPWIDNTFMDFLGDEKGVLLKIFRQHYPEETEEFIEEVVTEVLKSNEDVDEDEWLDEYQLIFGPILEGLVYAFEHGFSHRDLKPANVFIELQLPEDDEDDEDEEGVLVPFIGDYGASKNWNKDVQKGVTLAALYTEPWTPSPQNQNENYFQTTWDVFSWGVMAIAYLTQEIPKTYEDTKTLLDTKFKEKVGENLHTYLSRTVSLVPDERPSDVKQLHKDITKLNKDRMKAWKASKRK